MLPAVMARRILAVGNLNGGTGKTTVAVNLGFLASPRRELVLIDADNYMKVATLTSSLLARKGAAVPSTFAPTAMPPAPPAAVARKAPQAADTGGAVARPKRNGTGRIKMSLRLKPDQHLKLKLVAAFRRESTQKLLVAAIERYLD